MDIKYRQIPRMMHISHIFRAFYLVTLITCFPWINSYAQNSLGKYKKEIVLKNWESLSAQLSFDNVKYVVAGIYDLKGIKIVLPKGSVLMFRGGRIINGILISEDGAIEGENVNSLINAKLQGNWNLTSVYPEWFGAIGDGKVDDSDAIQMAADLASGKSLVLTKNHKYKYTKGIKIKSNTKIIGNNATIVKTCYSPIFLNEHFNADIIDRNISISGLNCETLNNSYRGLWIWMTGVENLKIKDCSFSNHTSLNKDSLSQWDITVSGKNIEISDCKIDNSKGGFFSDGIHIYNVEHCYIHDCDIITDDDCIGFCPEIPEEQRTFKKYNSISDDIVVCNNRLTGKRNCIRFEIRENAPHVFAYKNVTVRDIVLNKQNSSTCSFIYIHDFRNNTSLKDGPFRISNICVNGIVKGVGRNFIEVFGKNPVTLPPKVNNIKDVNISCINVILEQFENSLRCISADNVTMHDCSFNVIEGSETGMAIRDCASFNISSCELSTYSKYPFVQIKSCSGNLVNNKLKRLSVGNSAGIGISLEDAENVKVDNNELSNFAIGLVDYRKLEHKEQNKYERCNVRIQRQHK